LWRFSHRVERFGRGRSPFRLDLFLCIAEVYRCRITTAIIEIGYWRSGARYAERWHHWRKPQLRTTSGLTGSVPAGPPGWSDLSLIRFPQTAFIGSNLPEEDFR